MTVEINILRLENRIKELGKIGCLPNGGVCRLALTDADKAGRDLVTKWMKEQNLRITIDEIGNVVGFRDGLYDLPPVLIGSHIDTVATGGIYDGNLGVLSGLEVLSVLEENHITTHRPVAVGFFTNEEGCAIPPDMMGSMVHQGHLPLNETLRTLTIDGTTVDERLKKIGYKGNTPVNSMHPHTYFELHIEQGPILDSEKITIGAVEGVQGISWQEIIIKGVSNHAGTTPMNYRCDAGLAAAKITCFVNELANQMGNKQLATVGVLHLSPSLINVIAAEAELTVDLRNIDEEELQNAEKKLQSFLHKLSKDMKVEIKVRRLARFSPTPFNPILVNQVESIAKKLGYSVKRIISGAGHDAQSFAPNCPSAMIFIPNRDGISHNITEYASPEHIKAGAEVLLNLVLAQCSSS